MSWPFAGVFVTFGLSAAIGRPLDSFTSGECANYFAAARYDAG
jgi:hypothetical protein